MKKYTNNKRIQNMFTAAIDKKAIKAALNDPVAQKELLKVLNKIKY